MQKKLRSRVNLYFLIVLLSLNIILVYTTNVEGGYIYGYEFNNNYRLCYFDDFDSNFDEEAFLEEIDEVFRQ